MSRAPSESEWEWEEVDHCRHRGRGPWRLFLVALAGQVQATHGGPGLALENVIAAETSHFGPSRKPPSPYDEVVWEGNRRRGGPPLRHRAGDGDGDPAPLGRGLGRRLRGHSPERRKLHAQTRPYRGPPVRRRLAGPGAGVNRGRHPRPRPAAPGPSPGASPLCWLPCSIDFRKPFPKVRRPSCGRRSGDGLGRRSIPTGTATMTPAATTTVARADVTAATRTGLARLGLVARQVPAVEPPNRRLCLGVGVPVDRIESRRFRPVDQPRQVIAEAAHVDEEDVGGMDGHDPIDLPFPAGVPIEVVADARRHLEVGWTQVNDPPRFAIQEHEHRLEHPGRPRPTFSLLGIGGVDGRDRRGGRLHQRAASRPPMGRHRSARRADRTTSHEYLQLSRF